MVSTQYVPLPLKDTTKLRWFCDYHGLTMKGRIMPLSFVLKMIVQDFIEMEIDKIMESEEVIFDERLLAIIDVNDQIVLKAKQ